jgi:hypothetical protein
MFFFSFNKKRRKIKTKSDFGYDKKENVPIVFAHEKNEGGKIEEEKNREKNVIDKNKRAFLKLAGGAGFGLLLALLWPKKASALVMGGTPSTSVVGVKDSSNNRIDPAKEGGNLATVATNTGTISTNTAPFLVNNAGGYIRQDSTATIAKETGGNLASIKFSTDPFVVAGAGGYIRQDSTATIAKETGGNLASIATTASTLASEDAITYLRRIVKLMESQAVTDSAQRQKITLDSITGSLTLATITTVGTVSTVTSATALGGVDARYLYIDTAHNAYANAVRPNLIWS